MSNTFKDKDNADTPAFDFNNLLGRRDAAFTRAFSLCNEDYTQLSGILTKLNGSVAVTQSGTWNVTNISGTISLPTGASTAANQATANGYLATIATAASSANASNVTLSTEAISKSDGTQLTPKFAKIAASTSGDNSIVAAVTSKKIRVLAYNFMFAGTANAKFVSDVSGGSPVDLTGLKYGVANGGISAPFNPVGWFETASGKALILSLSAAIAVGGELVYIEV